MARFLRVLAAVVVGVTTLLVAHPADAAGVTYRWVATGQGDFANPANWVRGSDGEHGVPGPDDIAQITDPPGLVTVTTAVTVAGLTVVASAEGEDLDFGIYGVPGGSLTATSASLGGDVWIRGPLTAEDLTLSGRVEVDGEVTLTSTTQEVRPRLVLDRAEILSLLVLHGDPAKIEVAGDGPSTVEGISVPRAELHLTSEAGATFAGRVYGGDLTIVGDVPEGARVYGGPVDDLDDGTVSWTQPADAVLSGHVIVSDGWTAVLPDHLTVDGMLDLVGPSSGGSVDVGPEGSLRFTDRGPGGSQEADLGLSGTFATEAGGSVWVDPGDITCVGDENLLISAAGGVTFPPGEMHLDAPPTWFDLEGQALGDELVAVARRTDDEVNDLCAEGGSERIARSMYRDLLGRRADTGGAAYWAHRFDGGAPPTSVVSGLLFTSEAWTNLASSTYDVWACDDEAPSTDAVASAAAFLRAGGGLTALRADVLAESIGSEVDPVDCIYSAVLGRNPDPGGRAYVGGRLETESVQKVARKLMVSSEGRRVQFDRLYQHLLGRDATPQEIALRVQQVSQGRTEMRVTEQIAGSSEYVTRSSV